jgi:hypothetical protein
MMQLYNGPWQAPAEGIALYDILDRKGEVLALSKSVTIEQPLGHKLYQLSAIENAPGKRTTLSW